MRLLTIALLLSATFSARAQHSNDLITFAKQRQWATVLISDNAIIIKKFITGGTLTIDYTRTPSGEQLIVWTNIPAIRDSVIAQLSRDKITVVKEGGQFNFGAMWDKFVLPKAIKEL